MNRLSRNGVQPRPSLPIVCMTMPFSMNSTEVSARLRTPFGAAWASLRPARMNTSEPSTAAATAMRAILLNELNRSCQRRIELISGKEKDSAITTIPVGYGRVGFRPG